MQDRYYAKKDSHKQEWTGKMEDCTYVSANKEDANRILNHLLRVDLVRKDLKIRYDGNTVMIPVRKTTNNAGFVLKQGRFERRSLNTSPLERARIRGEEMGIRIDFPEKVIRLGRALIIKENRYRKAPRKALEIISSEFSVDSIYVDMGIEQNVQRKPDIRLIYGPGGDIIHLENGIRYRLDPGKVMFSPGNVNIRGAALSSDLSVQTVIDMFAGIGYFTLPLAQKYPYARIYACELNRVSVDYLRSNVTSNNFERTVEVLSGDCRITTRGLMADYIIMGHFQSSEFLNAALKCSHKGTLVNLHLLSRTDEMDTKWTEIQKKASQFGYLLDLVSQKNVKSYSAHLWHISVVFRVSGILQET